MKRTLIYIVVILAAFLLQSTIFEFIALADIVPNMLIILTASIGLIRGRSEGCVVGFFCGLLMDISSGDYLELMPCVI